MTLLITENNPSVARTAHTEPATNHTMDAAPTPQQKTANSLTRRSAPCFIVMFLPGAEGRTNPGRARGPAPTRGYRRARSAAYNTKQSPKLPTTKTASIKVRHRPSKNRRRSSASDDTFSPRIARPMPPRIHVPRLMAIDTISTTMNPPYSHATTLSNIHHLPFRLHGAGPRRQRENRAATRRALRPCIHEIHERASVV